MLIFHILCAAAFIAVAWTDIPYDKIDLKIINNEGKLRKTLKELKEIYEEQAILTGTAIATALSGASPIIGVAASLLPILIDAVKSISREEALANAISDGAKKEIVKQEIRKLESRSLTIDEDIKLLKSGTDSKPRFKQNEKRWIVLIIHNALNEIINDFAHPKSVFREYATLPLQQLFALTVFISVYDRLEKALHPALGNLPISCKFFDILLEYRSIVIRYRLTRLEIYFNRGHRYSPSYHFQSSGIDVKKVMFNVLGIPFNQYGYNKKWPNAILCKSIDCGSSQMNLYLFGERFTKFNYIREGESCLIDRSSGLYYNAGYFGGVCVQTYMQLLRHRIEKAFKEPLDLMDLACPEERRKQRKPTGYGWLTVNIEKVTTMRISCDIFEELGNLCDPYVKIIFDGEEVHKTETITNTNVAFFLDTYISQKINKSTKIVFEVWDEDGGLSGPDEPLFRFEIDIPELLRNTEAILYDFNNISWKSVWRDDYQ